MHRNQNSDTRKWPTSFQVRLLYFLKFFRFSFFPFSFLFAAVIGFLMGLLAVKKLQRKRQWDEQILPWSSHNFAPNFSPNFLCIWYLTCHYAECSDLGIIGKIFSTCRSWVYMYANFGQKWLCQKWKAKARHGLHNRIAKLENKSSNINSCLKSCSNCMDTSDIEFVWPWPFV